MFAALTALGSAPSFDDINNGAFVSGQIGSTGHDLMALAEKYGAAATFRPRMTVAELRASAAPVVLHASGAASRPGFNHWILFLGFDGNIIRVYDPPRQTYSMSAAELLNRWDGTGIVISRRKDDRRSGLWDLELSFAVTLVAAFALLVPSCRQLRRRPLAAMIMVSLSSALLWHSIVSYGFVGNRYELATVAARYRLSAMEVVTTEQMETVLGAQDVVIIDARHPDSYHKSHVPGAINIPVSVSHNMLREALGRIAPDNRVIVYCQSERCSWADVIARQFAEHGYKRVAIYRAGFNGWQARPPSTAQAAAP
ncbi:MAG: hypothetical protein HY290_33570 [Planctomycetia bacterium]|nr:hypothetical protein [Planctomycetia bacterium]